MEASDRTEIESLLAHAAWLSALARRLVGDPAQADDLVQDTWHAVLRAPREVRSGRGWLAALLRNAARARGRSEGARRERERRAAAPEAIDGPDALVERAEAQRRLLEGVLALDEPYRGVILARYVDGRSPAEIARVRGVNESTVRTWLARGHEQLRGRLAREHGRDWALALAPLVRRGATSAGPPAAAAGATIGAWTMSAGTSWMLTAAGVAVLAWWAWSSRGELAASPDVPVTSTAASAPPAREFAGAEPERLPPQAAREELPATSAETASQASETPPPPTATLDIAVERDGAPFPGVGVWIAPQKEWSMLDCLDVNARAPDTAVSGVTDRAGVASFGQLVRGQRFTVGLDTVMIDTSREPARPTRFVTSGLQAGYRHVVSLGSAAVQGIVFDASGNPRAGVGVQTYDEYARPSYLAAMTVTNASGEYRIDDLDSGSTFVIVEADGRFDGRGERQLQRIHLGVGEERELDFGSYRGTPRWTGRVRNAFGEPFPGVGVLSLNRDEEGLVASASIGPDGEFEIPAGSGAWQLTVSVAGAPGGGIDLGTVELPSTDHERDVIVPGTRLTGSVHRATGERALQGLSVNARPKGQDYPAAFRKVTTDAEGQYVLDGLEPGLWVVGVHPGELSQGELVEVTIAAGEPQIVLDLVLAD